VQKFEQIIEQAFAKIDASDPKMRQKVYENIWLVQEKALARQNLNEEQKQRWRQNLTELLKAVESQYRPRPAPARPPRPAAQPQFTAADAEPPAPRPRRTEPGFSAGPEQTADYAAAELPETAAFFPENEDSPRREQGSAAAEPPARAAPPLAAAPRRDKAAAERGKNQRRQGAEQDYLEEEVSRKVREPESVRPFWRRVKLSSYIIAALSALVALFVIWSFYNSFGGSAAPPRRAQFTGPMHQNNYGMNGWTEVFNPANVSGLATAGAAAADLHNEPDASFIRIATQNPETDAAILDIGQGALLKLRGKTATFKLMARSAENQIGQLRLVADFGAGAPRQRYSFELSPTISPLLFRLDIPPKLSGSLRFYLTNDKKDGQQHQADIFSLLVRESDDKGH